MARGKSTFITWFCSVCNKPNYITTYNKRSNDKVTKDKKKFCNATDCRKHTKHVRKDAK